MNIRQREISMKKVYNIILLFLLLFINIQCISPLIQLSEEGNEKEVKMLLDKGTDVNDKNEWNESAIYKASYKGHAGIVKMLLDKGANPDEGIEGAAESGNIELVKLLLDKGAKPNAGINEAVLNGNIELVQLLLDKGADINFQKGNWAHKAVMTPLAYAAHSKKYDKKMAVYLINNGADIDLAISKTKNQIKNLREDKYANTVHFKELIANEEDAITRLETLKSSLQPGINYKEQYTSNKNIKVKKYYGPKVTIAVLDFITKDVSQSIVFNVSELIRTELINTGKYTMVERSQMNEILKEQGFQQTGCTETSCAVQIGKLLSARKILVGSVMKMGNKLIISGRIVDVEKGIAEAGATGKTNSIDELDSGVIEFINNLAGF